MAILEIENVAMTHNFEILDEGKRVLKRKYISEEVWTRKEHPSFNVVMVKSSSQLISKRSLEKE